MHETTIRFTAELWAQLEREAARTGVSGAQYNRDATLERLAYTAGSRGDGLFAGATAPARPHADERARDAGSTARENLADATAVWAQAGSRARARTVRDEARAARAQLMHVRTIAVTRKGGD